MHERIGKRITFSHVGAAVEVRIPTLKIKALLIFLPVWWTGWTAGGIFAIVALLLGDPPGGALIVVWLIFWFGFWVFTAYAWLWDAFGNEVITFDHASLRIKRDLFGRGPSSTFVVLEISRLRAAGLFGGAHTFERSLSPWGLTGGMIAFEVGGKTRRFGLQLQEEEAHALVDTMRSQLPDSVFEAAPGGRQT